MRAPVIGTGEWTRRQDDENHLGRRRDARDEWLLDLLHGVGGIARPGLAVRRRHARADPCRLPLPDDSGATTLSTHAARRAVRRIPMKKLMLGLLVVGSLLGSTGCGTPFIGIREV